MRDWSDVRNAGHFDTQCIQSTNARLTAWAWSFDKHFNCFDTAFLCSLTSNFSSDLSSKGSGLA